MAARVTVHHQTEAQVGTATAVDVSATSFDRSFQTTLSDVGAGAIRLQNDDALLAAIDKGEFIRFSLDGTPRFLMLVEKLDTVAIAPNEEVDEVTTISGRGSLAMWESAVVLPPNGVTGQPYTETRTFDWGAPELDLTGWPVAVEIAQAGQGSEGVPPPDFPVAWLGYPLGWSDPTGYWTWSVAASTGPVMPAGTSYFCRDVNVTTAGYHSVYMAADNRHQLRIDGVLISEFDDEGSQEGYQFTLRADVYLTAGVHRIAVKATNDSGSTLAGFLFALWSQDANRDDDTLILRADDSWGAVGYPDEAPGFTAGEVIRILLEDAQGEGALTNWSLSFTDTHDSDGAAWPEDQVFSFRVGMDLLSCLRQMAATDIDFKADPDDLVLHAYKIDTMGVPSGSASAVMANLSYLEFRGRS